MKTKIFAVLTALLLALSSIAVYGAEEALPQLTIKDAVAKAVSHSSSIKQNQENKAVYEYNMKEARDNMLASETTSAYLAAYKNYLDAQWSLAQLDPNSKTQKEQLEYQLTEYFSTIIGLEKGLELTDKSLEQTKSELDIYALKLKLGLISQSEYDLKNYNYEKSVADRDATLISIDSWYRTLNERMGQTKDKKYELILELTYEPIGEDFDVKRVITLALQQNAAIKSAEQDLTWAKYKQDTSLNYDERTGEYDGGVKITNDNAVAQAGRALETKKSDLEANILNAYDAAVKLEREYDSYVKELTQAKADLEILKLKLEQGKITPLEVAAKELSIENLEEKIRSTVYSHAVKVMPLMNTDLL